MTKSHDKHETMLNKMYWYKMWIYHMEILQSQTLCFRQTQKLQAEIVAMLNYQI